MSAFQQEAPVGFGTYDTFEHCDALLMIEMLADRIVEESIAETSYLAYSIRAIARLQREQLQVMSPFYGEPKTVLYVRESEGEEE